MYFMEVFNILPATFETNASVQHQETDQAEIHFYFDAEIAPFVKLADVHGVGSYVGGIIELGVGLGEGFFVAVDEGDFHAMLVAEFGDCETDAAGGTRDQGGVSCFEDGV